MHWEGSQPGGAPQVNNYRRCGPVPPAPARPLRAPGGELVSDWVAGKQRCLGRALGASSDPAEIIRSAVDAYWHHIESHPLEHLLSYELTSYALRQPGNEVAAVAQYDYYFSVMAALLGKAAEIGGFEWRTPMDV